MLRTTIEVEGKPTAVLAVTNAKGLQKLQEEFHPILVRPATDTEALAFDTAFEASKEAGESAEWDEDTFVHLL